MTSAIKHKRRSQYSCASTAAVLGRFDHAAARKNISKQVAHSNKEIGLLTRLRNFFGPKKPDGEN
ncbi:MAG: hypothetical protein PHE79_08655 [Eubacteriales bacterium]|nr:hypothetical protein [Eubacteriales bacterium]